MILEQDTTFWWEVASVMRPEKNTRSCKSEKILSKVIYKTVLGSDDAKILSTESIFGATRRYSAGNEGVLALEKTDLLLLTHG